MGDWGHIQLIDLRTMTKAGNDCPRSVTYPQQDQNQLDGNDRVSVVCVRNLWKSEAMNVNWHVKVVCEESSKRWTKRSLPKGCQQVQAQGPYWRLKFANKGLTPPAADPSGPGPLLHHAGQLPQGPDIAIVSWTGSRALNRGHIYMFINSWTGRALHRGTYGRYLGGSLVFIVCASVCVCVCVCVWVCVCA